MELLEETAEESNRDRHDFQGTNFQDSELPSSDIVYLFLGGFYPENPIGLVLLDLNPTAISLGKRVLKPRCRKDPLARLRMK